MNSCKAKYITFLSFFVYAFAKAQDTIKQVAQDSSDIDVIPFKEGIKERYSGDEFNYNINDTGGVNLIQRILRKFFGWLSDLFGFDISYVNYQTLEYIIYGLLGCGAFYLLLKFLLENPVSSVFKTETKTIDGFNYVEEDIETVDFDKLINSALKENNYRLATRFLYLKSLKSLSSKGIIEWHYDKTNNDYLREIKSNDTKSLFKRASYIYDYVWYGEFPIDEAGFNKNKDDFNSLIKLKSNG
ncbi:hypothetical protein DFQ05_1941 [Winogradskyella wandonensis]|uniref:DUF4129 domain-containing protein n=1 Tax=Winogradskyella wandonensis TaxID=1442586 RepID=A0A4R1KNN0_9FLAO|nr:hypothetical protein [Winogradskyella wandonensis]TCK66668.1 hypothetical protein DFQ05_1941 [Winogradskyella wandonensis]